MEKRIAKTMTFLVKLKQSCETQGYFKIAELCRELSIGNQYPSIARQLGLFKTVRKKHIWVYSGAINKELATKLYNDVLQYNSYYFKKSFDKAKEINVKEESYSESMLIQINSKLDKLLSLFNATTH